MDLAGDAGGDLCDDAESWKAGAEKLALDGFIYDRLAGSAPTDADARVEWLCLQRPDFLGGFRPQPWEQLIAVLRAMGHPEEARKVAIAKQRRLRRLGQAQMVDTAASFALWRAGRLRLPSDVAARLDGRDLAGLRRRLLGGDQPRRLRRRNLSPRPSAGRIRPERAPAGLPQLRPPHLFRRRSSSRSSTSATRRNGSRCVADRAGNPLISGRRLRFLYWFEIAFGWVAGLLLVGVLGNLIKKD